jgi:hypothetical protein
MKNQSAKLAAVATVMGLGALGGVALGTNPGTPTAVRQGSAVSQGIVTSTSGAATAVSRPVALRGRVSTRAPIVTAASGAVSPRAGQSDD